MSELIREDWHDMVTTFFFPRQNKLLTDERIRAWVQNTNRELLEPDQESGQIKNIAAKASRFMMSNIWILENLISTLMDE